MTALRVGVVACYGAAALLTSNVPARLIFGALAALAFVDLFVMRRRP